jgi:hypothetical protein
VTFDELTDLFGGHTGLAEALGLNRSTVSTWKIRGAVPNGEKWRIFLLAEKRRIPITTKDLETLRLKWTKK